MDNYVQQCSQGEHTVIPDEEHTNLTAAPTLDEVRENLFRMGPDKAPGPDGLTAHFLQTNWELFKHDLTKAISMVFQTTNTPSEWLSSQIILIPKNEQPTTPRDYRPITIGNVVYILLMKIIASRLQ